MFKFTEFILLSRTRATKYTCIFFRDWPSFSYGTYEREEVNFIFYNVCIYPNLLTELYHI